MRDLCVREFGLLVRGSCDKNSLDICGVDSQEAWKFLEDLAFSDIKNHRFIEPARHGGSIALRVMNFVGVIGAPDGTRIEILPKTSDTSQDRNTTRALLWKMLDTVEDLNFLETTEARLGLRSAPLAEALIAIFLGHVASLVRRGIRRDYERVEDEERFLRGRLRLARQMQLPPGRQHLFPIEYDLFSENRAENRLVHAALAKVARSSHSLENQRLARELQHGFDPVPRSTDYRSDFSSWRLGREMAHYQPVLPWLKLILGARSPFSLNGEHFGISFLFPMEKLFEKYVAQMLKRRLAPHGINVRSQVCTEFLATQPRAFRLKPDLVLEKAGRWLSVLDTKWKLINREAAYAGGTSDPKAGIAQSDMYQLFAYGHKYLGGKGRLFLIYPEWSGFSAPLPPFTLGEALTLEVMPFDLTTDECRLVEDMLGYAPGTRPVGLSGATSA